MAEEKIILRIFFEFGSVKIYKVLREINGCGEVEKHPSLQGYFSISVSVSPEKSTIRFNS